MSEKSSSEKFIRRNLKVYYGQYAHDSKQHPVIRLGGKYLQALFNFNVGDTIEVSMHSGEIRIRKIGAPCGK
ncbi:MAG: hypothetical protein HY841_05385 [Bacteroidetes bacterium]|nr:hypothetical protein [Bacteroidota bacterium]